MRKDASVLRNHDLKMKIVELDVGFHVVVSKVRNNVSSQRYPDFKITCIYEFGPISIVTDLGARSIIHKSHCKASNREEIAETSKLFQSSKVLGLLSLGNWRKQSQPRSRNRNNIKTKK